MEQGVLVLGGARACVLGRHPIPAATSKLQKLMMGPQCSVLSRRRLTGPYSLYAPSTRSSPPKSPARPGVFGVIIHLIIKYVDFLLFIFILQPTVCSFIYPFLPPPLNERRA